MAQTTKTWISFWEKYRYFSFSIIVYGRRENLLQTYKYPYKSDQSSDQERYKRNHAELSSQAQFNCDWTIEIVDFNLGLTILLCLTYIVRGSCYTFLGSDYIYLLFLWIKKIWLELWAWVCLDKKCPNVAQRTEKSMLHLGDKWW